MTRAAPSPSESDTPAGSHKSVRPASGWCHRHVTVTPADLPETQNFATLNLTEVNFNFKCQFKWQVRHASALSAACPPAGLSGQFRVLTSFWIRGPEPPALRLRRAVTMVSVLPVLSSRFSSHLS